jgi:hypothetical protein
MSFSVIRLRRQRRSRTNRYAALIPGALIRLLFLRSQCLRAFPITSAQRSPLETRAIRAHHKKSGLKADRKCT